MADITIPKREDAAEEYTWDLRDLFESDEAWKSEYESLKNTPEELEAYRGRLGESAETLLGYLKFNDTLSVRLERLYGYANCKSDQDTSNAFYQDKAHQKCHDSYCKKCCKPYQQSQNGRTGMIFPIR